MKTFASKEKRSAPMLRKTRPYIHNPMGPVQQVQRATIHHILRSAGVQAKLTIGRPNDKYEQEANRVAERVMAMPDPKLQCQPESEEEEEMVQAKPLVDQITPLVQRQAQTPEEEEEPVQTKSKDGEMIQCMCPSCDEEIAQRQPMEEEGEELQPKSKTGEASEVSAGTGSRIKALQGSGRPMSASERHFFEPRFGTDFSGVRVHNDAQAASAAQSIGARAFTLRKDVVFGAGEYAPDSPSGRKLFAHELVHVGQQNHAQMCPTPLARPLAQAKAEQGKGEERLQTKGRSGQALIQRDLATPPPATPAPAQAALSAAQVRSAIRFNRRRYNVVGTRLIQDLVGTTPTGTWVEADIRAIAAIQEEYGLSKDGRVGTRTFRFIDTEVRNERLRRSDANCLTSLVINRGAQNIAPRANGATMTRRFTMRAQFPRYCGCRNFEYRQFIRGHLRVRRGAVVHDQGAAFSTLPAGRLNTAWQEDGHTGVPSVNFGYRSRAGSADDRYLPTRAHGCRYEGEDTPGGNYTGVGGFTPTTGDIININVNFRGEIRRNGRVVRSKRWSALRRRFRLP